MTWTYEQAKCNWLETEAGEFLHQSEIIVPRVRNIIMRHYIFQFHPRTGHMYTWKMEGTIEELELITNDERPVAGIGDVGRENLREVLSAREEKANDIN